VRQTKASETTVPCEVDDGSANELERLMPDDVPVGYEVAPDAAEDTGPTDLDLAASFVGVPDERTMLSALGFRRGYQRLWYGPDGAKDLIVHLYEFCDAHGPTGYLLHTRQRLLSPMWGSVELDGADFPEGVGLLQEADPGDESFIALLQVHGAFYVEVGAYGVVRPEALGALTARARELAEAQVAKLREARRPRQASRP